MEKIEFKKAVQRFNKLMYRMCLEHLSIGTPLTEDRTRNDKWNIRDLVSECQYQLDTYYEEGHNNHELLKEGSDGKRVWKAETEMYKRFIKKYLPYIKDVKCVSRHLSKYDN